MKLKDLYYISDHKILLNTEWGKLGLQLVI